MKQAHSCGSPHFTLPSPYPTNSQPLRLPLPGREAWAASPSCSDAVSPFGDQLLGIMESLYLCFSTLPSTDGQFGSPAAVPASGMQKLPGSSALLEDDAPSSFRESQLLRGERGRHPYLFCPAPASAFPLNTVLVSRTFLQFPAECRTQP